MTVTEVQSLRAVERHLAALYDRFEEVPVREDLVVVDPPFFEHGQRAAEHGRLASVGAWVTDDRGRLLFVRADGSEEWGPPAGTGAPGEDLLETARRETVRASGVGVRVTGLWYVEKRTIVNAENPDRRLHTAEAWFEAEPTDPGVVPDPSRTDAAKRIAEARWFAEPPDAIEAKFLDRVTAWASE